jgi:hypothetical protein
MVQLVCWVWALRYRPAARVPAGCSFLPREIMAAMASIAPLQQINMETRAVHVANGNIIFARCRKP